MIFGRQRHALMIAKAWWFSIIIAVCWLGWAYWWAQGQQTVDVVHISAPHDAATLIPVYAQFTVTQTVTLPEDRLLTSITIPLQIPDQPHGELVIELRQRDHVLQHWIVELSMYQAQPSQVVELTLPIKPNQLVSGELELQLAAPSLDAHYPEQAPGVLVETDDQIYSGGHYAIANNPKKGDMALTIHGMLTHWELYRQQWHSDPVIRAYKLLRLLFVSWLFVSLPQLLQAVLVASKRKP